MFDKENVSIRFNSIQPRKMVKDEQEITLLEIELEVNPFTPELAKELDDDVRQILYTRTEAEPKQKIKAVAFDLNMQPQIIVARMAPDMDASFTLDEVKISGITARRSKKSSAWRLVFKATCAPIAEHQLAQIIECYTQQRYLTFAIAQPDLFSTTKQRTRSKASSQAAAAAAASAPATH